MVYFEQQPMSHLQGQGCFGCYGSSKKITEQFIKEASNSKYKYDYVKYVNAITKVKIVSKTWRVQTKTELTFEWTR